MEKEEANRSATWGELSAASICTQSVWSVTFQPPERLEKIMYNPPSQECGSQGLMDNSPA